MYQHNKVWAKFRLFDFSIFEEHMDGGEVEYKNLQV